jgi:hypothetical protein
MSDKSASQPAEKSTWRNKVGLAEMLKGGVIMDVTTADQAKSESDEVAPYLDGDGYLRYGGRTAGHLIVYRRHNNPTPWTVPLAALIESRRIGRFSETHRRHHVGLGGVRTSM